MKIVSREGTKAAKEANLGSVFRGGEVQQFRDTFFEAVEVGRFGEKFISLIIIKLKMLITSPLIFCATRFKKNQKGYEIDKYSL